MNPLHCFFTLCHPSKAYAAVHPHADATCPELNTRTKPRPMGNEILLTRKASYGVMFKKNHHDRDPTRDFSKLPFLMKLNANKFLSKKALSSHPDRLNVTLSLIPGRYAFFLLQDACDEQYLLFQSIEQAQLPWFALRSYVHFYRFSAVCMAPDIQFAGEMILDHHGNLKSWHLTDIDHDELIHADDDRLVDIYLPRCKYMCESIKDSMKHTSSALGSSDDLILYSLSGVSPRSC